MGRLINTDDLHNETMKSKNEWGIFAPSIDNLIESIVSRVPTADLDKHDEEIIKQTVHSIWAKDTISQMRAMLINIQSEIEEKIEWEYANDRVVDKADIDKIFKKRINTLEE